MGSSTQRKISLAVSILIAVLLVQQIFHSLSLLSNSFIPEVYLRRTFVALFSFFFPIMGAWYFNRTVGGIVFTVLAAGMVFFTAVVSDSVICYWFLVAYAILVLFLLQLDQFYEGQIASLSVDKEKYQNEKNDLETSYKLKGEGISIFFEKYSTYYNLRKLAEELATTLSVSQLAKIAVERTVEFIPRGNVAFITLSDREGSKLSVVASKAIKKKTLLEHKEGDLFDGWAIRNRKRLIVNNTHQDFRFDVSKTAQYTNLRSLIIAPLFSEGRVIGTMRINASEPDVFSNDDLRLMDAMATLSSSALSNAQLYETTNELAIKDSLTGLYLRRYFYDRLKQEHRRSLLTKRPMTLIMCDIDYFKECNDKYGHGGGDLMLLQVAEILSRYFDHGIVSRYGGEEFAILLPEIAKDEGIKLAERVRKEVFENSFMIRRERVKMTLSMGVAGMPDDTLDIESLIKLADDALYEAKRGGRNKVCSNKG